MLKGQSASPRSTAGQVGNFINTFSRHMQPLTIVFICREEVAWVANCVIKIKVQTGVCGGSVVEHRTPEREAGVRIQPPPYFVLEQDSLLPERSDITQEAVAPSRHDRKVVDWVVKHQHKQPNSTEMNKRCIIWVHAQSAIPA